MGTILLQVLNPRGEWVGGVPKQIYVFSALPLCRSLESSPPEEERVNIAFAVIIIRHFLLFDFCFDLRGVDTIEIVHNQEETQCKCPKYAN